MTYSKEVTNLVVECWGLGFTAEETVRTINEKKGVLIGLATIYRKRHSLTAQQIIEELMLKQMRDIAEEEDSDLRMKYRDKLLEKLVPQRIEAFEKREVNVNTTVTNIDASLRDYQWALEEAARLNLQSNSKRQQVDSAQAAPEANPVPTA
jgi:hypothetical protein